MNKIESKEMTPSLALGSMIKKSFLAAIVVGSVMISDSGNANAQDLLPRDNGIFTYFKAPRWRESEYHPLRTTAYVFHPIGWVLREGIYRPWSYFVSSTPFTRSFFGWREPFDYRSPQCFFDTDVVPDCRQLSPMNEVSAPQRSGEGSGGEGSMVSERQVYFPDVAFDFNKSTLNELGKARVRQVSQLLASVPNLKVVVEGHTDYKGTDEYNMKLGSRRADAVVKELTELGVDPTRMTPVSFGEGRPLFTEDTDWARAANRRVQFSVNNGTAPTADLAPAKQ